MGKVTVKEVQRYVQQNGGSLVQLTNGNFNIRKGEKSIHVGKPGTDNKWDVSQLRRAWGDATDIPNPGWQ